MGFSNVCGKRSPEELMNAERGFDGFEIYLEEEDIFENYGKTVDLLKESGENISSIHTPHMKSYDEFQEALILCGRLAQKFDSSVVCHSSYIRWLAANKIIDFDSMGDVEYGLENYIGLSVPGIEGSILDENHNLVLDNAHLFLSNPDIYFENLSYLLDNYSHRITVIHLCDSNKDTDGLSLGKGILNLKKTVDLINSSSYDNQITIEVPVDEQEESREVFYDILDELN